MDIIRNVFAGKPNKICHLAYRNFDVSVKLVSVIGQKTINTWVEIW